MPRIFVHLVIPTKGGPIKSRRPKLDQAGKPIGFEQYQLSCACNPAATLDQAQFITGLETLEAVTCPRCKESTEYVSEVERRESVSMQSQSAMQPTGDAGCCGD